MGRPQAQRRTGASPPTITAVVVAPPSAATRLHRRRLLPQTEAPKHAVSAGAAAVVVHGEL